MIDRLLKERELPDFLGGVSTVEQWESKRGEMIDLISREEYGFSPPAPQRVVAVPTKCENLFGSKVDYKEILLSFELNNNIVSFPVRVAYPSAQGSYPTFVVPNFRPYMPDRYIPLEEICDNGFAVLAFDYNDAALDNDSHFADGIAAAAFVGGRKSGDCGKIGLWAYAASRVADYALTLAKTDAKNLAVVGHSRLGKTALWAGVLDTRFAFVMSNDAGCGGDALFRGKAGENAKKIYDRFPFWFCDNFAKYYDNERAMPFDSHWLLALVAPRRVCIGASQLDSWADPVSQYLSCCAAGGAYELYGLQGLIHPDYVPQEPCDLGEGSIGFHLRAGTHSFTRDDWHCYMAYIAKHKNV